MKDSLSLKVDKDGVPVLIQSIKYWYGMMYFKVSFFNGKELDIPSEFACPSIGLMQSKPSDMQMLEAQNNIEKYALANWRQING